MTLLLAICLVTQGKTSGTGWVEATSKDQTFVFAMPVKAAEKVTTQKTPNGPIEILEYSGTCGDCLYRVEKIGSPVEIPDEKLIGALAASRDSIARKSKILDDKAAIVAGWPARELVIEAPLQPGAAPSKIAMLICYADNNFYQVRVFASRPGTDPKEVRKFFDAFRPNKARPSKKEKP
jgi:hypothetical protein